MSTLYSFPLYNRQPSCPTPRSFIQILRMWVPAVTTGVNCTVTRSSSLSDSFVTAIQFCNKGGISGGLEVKKRGENRDFPHPLWLASLLAFHPVGGRPVSLSFWLGFHLILPNPRSKAKRYERKERKGKRKKERKEGREEKENRKLAPLLQPLFYFICLLQSACCSVIRWLL